MIYIVRTSIVPSAIPSNFEVANYLYTFSGGVPNVVKNPCQNSETAVVTNDKHKVSQAIRGRAKLGDTMSFAAASPDIYKRINK